MSSIKKRIIEYIDSKHLTEYEFCKKSGVTQGILKRKTGISEDNITKFIKYFPEVDVNWLITGNKKEIPQSIKEHNKPSLLPDGDGKQLSINYISEIESIHSEMKLMTKTIRRLKKEIKNQKKDIATISKQINNSEI